MDKTDKPVNYSKLFNAQQKVCSYCLADLAEDAIRKDYGFFCGDKCEESYIQIVQQQEDERLLEGWR
jgi:hypothetical protein